MTDDDDYESDSDNNNPDINENNFQLFPPEL